MALFDFMSLGGVEVANSARLAAYLTSVGSPLHSITACGCPTITAESLGDLPYTTPADPDSPAPWYDADVPVSEDFTGFLVLTVDGLDEYPVRRTVTNAVTGGGVLGPARALPRTIVVTGILLGRTCCGVEYGLHWLSEALQGCAGNECDGDCLELFNCCPDEELDEECLNEEHRRTLRRVALVDGPRVVERSGDTCTAGECAVGADILTVEFTLVAATPWLWTDPVPVIEVLPTVDDSDECITWCLDGGEDGSTLCTEVSDGACPPDSFGVEATDAACDLAWPVDEDDGPCDAVCRLAACTDPTALCADPLCRTPVPPTVDAPVTCFCLPLAVERRCCDVDLSLCPAWAVDVPIITARAGSADLRNITLYFYERSPNHEDMTCEEVADEERCNPLAVFHIAYVPAGGALTIDGQTGRAIVECGGVCESSPDVYGQDGGPIKFPTLTCAGYVICIESDLLNPPSSDSLVTVSVTGRGF
ncbi:hypothetical protein [Streptomyces sp. NPDC059063]|uniref:hypothetical protein n=1 Tax=Streptomyces sp. NPDC059063 TaxID=3346712 RepID=UPI0036D007CA